MNKDANARVNVLAREDDENILFETRDKDQKGAWVPRNYIKKNQGRGVRGKGSGGRIKEL